MKASQNYTCSACGETIKTGDKMSIRDGFITHFDCAEILDLMIADCEHNQEYAELMSA